MTITTAKRPGRALLLKPLALAALLWSAQCMANTTFTPSISLTERYSDNPGLRPEGAETAQFISEANPGFSLVTRTRRLHLVGSGSWHYYAYQKGNIPNLSDHERTYSAAMNAALVEDLLLLDAHARGSSRFSSAFGPQDSNLYSSLNRTDVKTWSISPILTHRFGATTVMRLQFTRDSVETDHKTTGFGDSLSSTGTLSLNGTTSANALGWSLQYLHRTLDTEKVGMSRTQNVSLNTRYRLSSQWTATATVGYDDNAYLALHSRTAGPSYQGGFIWTPSRRTSIDAAFGHNYLGKTGHLFATQRNRRLVSQVSYTDKVTTTRQQFLLPAAVDTAALLDQLFSSTISDPDERALAVQAYLTATGLPPSLAEPVNYLSNRYLRDQRLQAAYLYHMPHSTLALSVYKSQRTALSVQQSDSDLLGSQISSLNGNVRQRGINANFNYRLSSRTTASANLAAYRSTSVSTGQVSPTHQMSFGVTRQFDRKTYGNLEFHRSVIGPIFLIDGAANVRGERTENAISATLSVKL